MDPITTSIVAAVHKLSEPLVNDAYRGLKALIQRKFGKTSALASAVEGVEAQPSSAARAAVLAEEADAAGANDDAELARASQTLLEAAGGTPNASVMYQTVQQTVHHGENIVGIGTVTTGRNVRPADG